MLKQTQVIAYWRSWFLVQYGDDFFDVHKIDEVSDELKEQCDKSKLLNFSHEPHINYIANNGAASIENLGYITFGSGNTIIIYSSSQGEGVGWIFKTPYAALVKDGSVIAYCNDTKNDMSKKTKKMINGSRRDSASDIDTRDTRNMDRQQEQDTGPRASAGSGKPIPSRETPDPSYPNLLGMSNSHNARLLSREMSGSPDANTKSGLTPGPRDGGKIMYARHIDGDIRAIVERNGAHEIEKVETCPGEVLSTCSYSTSFGPGGDSDFLHQYYGSRRLQMSQIRMIGCAGKWSSPKMSQVYIYVFFELKNQGLLVELQEYRDAKAERYKGPIICSWSTFKGAIQTGKEDVIQLNRRLQDSQFAKEVLKVTNTPLGLKKSKKQQSTRSNNRMDTIENEIKFLKEMMDRLMGKLEVQLHL